MKQTAFIYDCKQFVPRFCTRLVLGIRPTNQTTQHDDSSRSRHVTPGFEPFGALLAGQSISNVHFFPFFPVFGLFLLQKLFYYFPDHRFSEPQSQILWRIGISGRKFFWTKKRVQGSGFR